MKINFNKRYQNILWKFNFYRNNILKYLIKFKFLAEVWPSNEFILNYNSLYLVLVQFLKNHISILIIHKTITNLGCYQINLIHPKNKNCIIVNYRILKGVRQTDQLNKCICIISDLSLNQNRFERHF